jgi:hypothetical protein
MTNRQIAAQALLNCAENHDLTIKQAVFDQYLLFNLSDKDLYEVWVHIDDMLLDQVQDNFNEQ